MYDFDNSPTSNGTVNVFEISIVLTCKNKDNKNNVIDVSVFNDVYVFGNSGDGVIFDYLVDFTEEYNINFNKVSYMSNGDSIKYKDLSFRILDSDKKLSDCCKKKTKP